MNEKKLGTGLSFIQSPEGRFKSVDLLHIRWRIENSLNIVKFVKFVAATILFGRAIYSAKKSRHRRQRFFPGKF